MGEILDARRYEQELVYQVRQLELDATFGAADLSLPEIKHLISDHSETLAHRLRFARADSRYNDDDKLKQTWTGNKASVTSRTSRGVPLKRMMDTATLFDIVIGNGATLSTINTTGMNQPPQPFQRGKPHLFNTSAHWSGVMDNAPIELSHLTETIVSETARAHRDNVKADQTILIVLLSIVASIPILLTVLVVVPSFVKVKKERKFVFGMLRRVPEEVLNELYLKHKAIGSTLKNDSSDKSSSYSSSTGGTSSNLDLGNLTESSVMLIMTRFSNAPTWIRLIFTYSLSLFLLMGVLFASVLLSYQVSVDLHRSSGEIGRAANRIGCVSEIMALTQEWIRGDAYVWPNITYLTQSIDSQIDQVCFLAGGIDGRRIGSIWDSSGATRRWDSRDP
jgi:hypothetical protein